MSFKRGDPVVMWWRKQVVASRVLEVRRRLLVVAGPEGPVTVPRQRVWKPAERPALIPGIARPRR